MPSSSREAQQQLQDLVLDGDVERGRRLVGEQQLGFGGERDGDHRALAHAAGELVRIVVEPRARRRGCRRGRAAPSRAGAARLVARAAVCATRLSSICSADGEHRVQRRHRLLEDHRDLAAAHVAQARLGHRQRSRPCQLTRPATPWRWAQQAQDRAQGHALARAGFADEAQHLARPHGEVDAVDGAHRAARRGEGDAAGPRRRASGSAVGASSLHVQQVGEAVAGEAEAEAAEHDGEAGEDA